MRTLTSAETEFVGGAADSAVNNTSSLMALGAAGLLVSIPVIVAGAILGVPTLGLGFVAMAVGIVATAISGALMIAGIVQSGVSSVIS